MAMLFPIVSFFVIRGAFCAVNLSPKTAVVIENSNLELNCSYSGAQSVTQWDKSDENTSAYVTDGCDSTSFLKEKLFAVSCDKTWTFVKMLSVKENQNKVIWRCSLPRTKENSTSQVIVIVPVISAEITSGSGEILSIVENIRTTLKCSTSISRPAPKVFWFLKRTDMDSIRDISNKASQTPPAGDENMLEHVISVLEYSFKRTDNGYHIFCVATNTQGPNVTSSVKILNVIFPPTLRTGENGSTYRFIEHRQGSLSCSATGGNPLANLIWNCFSGNVSSTEYNKTVTSTVSWKVFRNQDNQSCVCVADHILRKSWIAARIEVLYPPDTPIFRIGNRTIERVIRIIENNSLVIKCETNSNPNSWYKWNTETNHQTLIVANVIKQNAGEYICTVNNIMIATDGKIQPGTNSSSIELEVLYPPSHPFFTYSDNKTYMSEPIIGNKLDVVEGDIFSEACRSTGNPTPSYLWDVGKMNYYYVINASRSMNKTCTAANVMIETVGETKTGSNTATISIFVHYPPNIPKIRLSNGKDQEILAKKVIHSLKMTQLLCYVILRANQSLNTFGV